MTDPFATLLAPPPVPKAWPAERIKAHRIERPEDAEPLHLPRVANSSAQIVARNGNPWGIPPGEAEILDGLTRGLTRAGIAALRGVSVLTIKGQLKRSKEKMNAETTQQAVALWGAWRRGQA